MSTKKIITVGFALAGDLSTSAKLRSKTSLLDWDIVLFRPRMSEFFSEEDSSYLGKLSLGENGSFEAKESCSHWCREIRQAYDEGKTVVVFLPAVEEVYVHTGKREFSGTGRNQKTTHIVEILSNYSTLPLTLNPITAKGASMKLATRDADILRPYWAKFGEKSTYQVVLSNDVPAIVLTRTGDKAVGAIFRNKKTQGVLLLLPDIDFYPKGFLATTNNKQDWTPAAKQFGAEFVSCIVALDKALRSTAEVTPSPQWASDAAYLLEPERKLRAELLDAERAIEVAQRKRDTVSAALADAGELRGLLYENGKPLEVTIIRALQIMGFKAEPFKESDSEFDVVFESNEGRLIGEAEGKDNKAIGVDKLRQLSMNVHEDLQREEVTAPAKPVLFGNPFRLQVPTERGEPFTEKCKSAAEISNTALVATPDVFLVTQYLVRETDPEYARKVRMALLSSVGLVKFPMVPLLVEDLQTDPNSPNEACEK